MESNDGDVVDIVEEAERLEQFIGKSAGMTIKFRLRYYKPGFRIRFADPGTMVRLEFRNFESWHAQIRNERTGQMLWFERFVRQHSKHEWIARDLVNVEFLDIKKYTTSLRVVETPFDPLTGFPGEAEYDKYLGKGEPENINGNF